MPQRGKPKVAGKKPPTVYEAERAMYEHQLTICDGNKAEAARRLGVSYRTILRKTKAWAILDQLEQRKANSDKLASSVNNNSA